MKLPRSLASASASISPERSMTSCCVATFDASPARDVVRISTVSLMAATDERRLSGSGVGFGMAGYVLDIRQFLRARRYLERENVDARLDLELPEIGFETGR